MYARITTHEGGDTERLRQISNDKSSKGGVGLPDGVRRAIMLAGDKRRMYITFFDSREELAAAEKRFETMGNEIPEEIRGKRTSVEVYEVIADQSF
ncbi:MAG: hypothetical protein U0166_01510 [Acidobacteriota bacterium]